MFYKVRRQARDWYVLTGMVIIITIIYGSMFYFQRARLVETTVMGELRSIRLAISAFDLVYGRTPKDMDELAKGTFKDKWGEEKYFLPKRLIEKGMTDPNGKPYLYDPRSGWVRSASEEFQGW